MKTLLECWKELESKMKAFDEKVFCSFTANVDNKGRGNYSCFISIGEGKSEKQTSIHYSDSPQELMQKAEGWAKIVTTKLEGECFDVGV